MILVPYTLPVCKNLLRGDFSDLTLMGWKRGISWPDADVMETLPKIINNLSLVDAPTGFESWMIIKQDTSEIIGDAGFKGFQADTASIDLGYGIIQEERRKGYAREAATALIQWAFTNDVIKIITAKCLPDNTGSVHLLQQLNFTEKHRDDTLIYWSLMR